MERNGRSSMAIEPSSRRTATAMRDGERIITPSITAWPPTGRNGTEDPPKHTNGSPPGPMPGVEPSRDELGIRAGGGGRRVGGLRALLAVLPAEALDASRLVHQLLLAGEKRVTVRADIQMHLAVRCRRLQRGARDPLRVTAVAVERALFVCGMNTGLHGKALLNGGVPRPRAPSRSASPTRVGRSA